MTARADPSAAPEEELFRLRARVAELETQLVDTEAWANRAVANAQERTYWLDRWHVDLNAIMERPNADHVRALLRATRSVYRSLVRIRRRLSSGS